MTAAGAAKPGVLVALRDQDEQTRIAALLGAGGYALRPDLAATVAGDLLLTDADGAADPRREAGLVAIGLADRPYPPPDGEDASIDILVLRPAADDELLLRLREASRLVASRAASAQSAGDAESLRRLRARRKISGSLLLAGAWSLTLPDLMLRLSDEVRDILDIAPDAVAPSIAEAAERLDAESLERLRAAFLACVNDGVSVDEEARIVTRAGRPLWLRVVAAAERAPDGALVAIDGAIQDVTRRKGAEDAADRINSRLTATFESITDGFYMLDESWRFTYLNAEVEALLARSGRDLLGKVIWDELPNIARNNVGAAFRQAAETNQKMTVEQYYEPLKRWFSVNVYPSAEGFAVYFQDITQRRSAEEQLRLLDACVSRMNDIVLITEARPIDGPGPRIVYVNDAFERVTGYSRAEAIGQTPRILQGPRTDRVELDRIRDALENWRPVRAELVNYTKSGKDIWLDLDINPLADASGWFTHWVAVQRDTTERTTERLAKLESEERFRNVARATADTIWDWNLATDTVWWSEGLKTVFGYADPAEVGDRATFWSDHIHPEDRTRILDGVRAVIQGGEELWSGEYRFRRRDGAYAQVRDRGFVIHDPSGKAIRMVGGMSDVTATRELESRLRQTQRLQAIGQLTGGVAHDFNNLLTIILGNAEILAENLPDDGGLRTLAEMTCTAAERGADLVSRLMAFSRQQPLEPQVVDVCMLLSNIDVLLRRTLGELYDLRIVVAPHLWDAYIDAPQLEAAIINLCLNARDAMAGGGEILVELANAQLGETSWDRDLPAGDFVMASVSDKGHGMSADTVARAFEPFFTTKEVGKGSGLGLSMVQGFMQQSGGTVRIYSEIGQGTTVKMYLPRAASEEGLPAPRREPEEIRGGDERILLVEDDHLVRAHVHTQLIALGYDVVVAANGPQALEALRATPDFDLLFTDVVMPGGLNGREVAIAARTIQPSLRVLFTSGYTENVIVHDGRLDRGVHLLSKPYRQADLAAKVRLALDGA